MSFGGKGYTHNKYKTQAANADEQSNDEMRTQAKDKQ